MQQRKNRMILWMLTVGLVLAFLPLFGANAVDYTAEEVAAADRIIGEMQAEGVTGQYAQALWLHDWLTHHANYDYSPKENALYQPAGVLIHGKGICQSYTDAYSLLLNKVGIENLAVESKAMDHTWNLVRIDGTWCHVDVTWDDPDTGGEENHFFFGMTDVLISRDHTWEGTYPACTSDAYYAPVREEEAIPFTDDASMWAQLNAAMAEQPEEIKLIYMGGVKDYNFGAALSEWVSAYGAKYSLDNVNATLEGGQEEWGTKSYQAVLELTYRGSGETVQTGFAELETPLETPDFSLEGLAGVYRKSSYRGNGMLLIFGRNGCYNTKSLLQGLSSDLDTLYAGGIEVLVNDVDAAETADLYADEEWVPGYKFTLGQDTVMWTMLRSAGHENSVTFPCVFLINQEGKLEAYSTGYVEDVDALKTRVLELGTGKVLPEPTKMDYSEIKNGTGNVKNISGGSMVTGLQQSLQGGNHVIMVVNSNISGSNVAAYLQTWQDRHTFYESLGMKMVASAKNITESEKQKYPNINFVDFDDDNTVEGDFWKLLFNAGYSGTGSASYLCSYFYAPNGNCISYTNGSLLNLNACAVLLAEETSYDVHIPGSLTEMEEEAFAGSGFRNVDLTGGGLTKIGSGCFADCGNLHFVKIPATVTEIDETAFTGSDGVVFLCPASSAACRFAIRKGIPCLNN